MIASGPGDWLHDAELTDLRRAWVAAFRDWRQTASEYPPDDADLSAEQRVALRRYRNAETAYFTRSRKIADE